MKTLIVFRHGKSDWGADYRGDHSRPIAKRGRRAASTMGRFLALTEHLPDNVISSSARRAHETVELAHAAGSWECQIEIDDSFYEANVGIVLSRIRREADATEVLLIAGHEPTWSELVSHLSGGGQLRFPTAAMARIDLDIDHWSAVAPSTGRLIWLIPPRLLSDSGLEILGKCKR